MRRRYKYAFTKKERPRGIRFSDICGNLPVPVFGIGSAFLCMGRKSGKLDRRFRFYGDLVCRMWFFYRYEELSGKRKNYRLSVLGAMGNGVLFVGWLVLFLIGV